MVTSSTVAPFCQYRCPANYRQFELLNVAQWLRAGCLRVARLLLEGWFTTWIWGAPLLVTSELGNHSYFETGSWPPRQRIISPAKFRQLDKSCAGTS
jgi:hypothetical protein